MLNLLSAGFYRLKRDKLLWILMIVSAATALFGILLATVFSSFIKIEGEAVIDLTTVRALLVTGTNVSQNAGVLLVIMVSVYIGREYAYGTMRNKIISGKSRVSIYLSNLVLSVVAGLILLLVYQAVTLAVGAPVLGWPDFSAADLAITLVVGIFTFITATAVMTLISMLSRSQVLAIVLCFAFIMAGSIFASALSLLAGYAGSLAPFVKGLLRLTIFGQSLALSQGATTSLLVTTIVSSVVVTAAATAAGAALFQRLDIK